MENNPRKKNDLTNQIICYQSKRNGIIAIYPDLIVVNSSTVHNVIQVINSLEVSDLPNSLGGGVHSKTQFYLKKYKSIPDYVGMSTVQLKIVWNNGCRAKERRL